MITMLKYSRLWLVSAIAPLLLISCVKESVESIHGDDSMVTFTIQTPAAQPSTRALDANAENDVQQIDVVAYNTITGAYEYAARCSGTAITDNGTTKTFTVTMCEGTYDLMVLANAHDIVSAASLPGTTRLSLISSLEDMMPAGGKWIADVADPDYRPLPMWGQVRAQPISQGTTLNGSNAIVMTRMHAAVDIALTTAAQSNFRLESVRLYNYNTRGRVIPDADNTLAWNTSTSTPLLPSIPSAPGTQTGTANAIFYDNSDPSDDKTHYTGGIYLFEAANGGALSHPDNICLVVGGQYSDDGFSTSQNAYYRVDFSTRTGGITTWLDVMRNHKYTVNITGVTGPGYSIPDDAYNSALADFTVSIINWDLGGAFSFDLEGNRYIWLSDVDIRSGFVTGTFNITVETDNLSGWTATASTSATNAAAGAPSWITNLTASGVAKGSVLAFDVSLNNTGAVRYGYIHINAGPLTIVAAVTQNHQ